MRELRAPVAPDVSPNELLTFHVFFPRILLIKSGKVSGQRGCSRQDRYCCQGHSCSLHGTIYFLESQLRKSFHWICTHLKKYIKNIIFWSCDIRLQPPHPTPDSASPLRRHVCAAAGVAVPAARPPASGDPVPGFDSAEPQSQTQVPLPLNLHTVEGGKREYLLFAKVIIKCESGIILYIHFEVSFYSETQINLMFNGRYFTYNGSDYMKEIYPQSRC